MFIDQLSEERYTPLNNITSNQQNFEVIDSPLSEASVLGFEYGYSLTEPTALVTVSYTHLTLPTNREV